MRRWRDYSDASSVLHRLVERTGIPVAETQAGKGALVFANPQNLDAMGVTGTPGANIIAREADVVIAIGTRLSDFTTASKTAFQNPDVRFISINVVAADAYKHGGIPLVADARVTLEEMISALDGYRVSDEYARACRLETGLEMGQKGYQLSVTGRRSARGVIGAVNSRAQTWWFAPLGAFPAICTNSGARAIRKAITSSTAIHAWAMKSRAGSESRWPIQIARSM